MPIQSRTMEQENLAEDLFVDWIECDVCWEFVFDSFNVETICPAMGYLFMLLFEDMLEHPAGIHTHSTHWEQTRERGRETELL